MAVSRCGDDCHNDRFGRMRLVVQCVMLVLLLCRGMSPSAMAQVEADAKHVIDIPQQNAEDAVKSLARIHQRSLLFQTEDIVAVHTNPLRGRFSLQGALDKMFEGTSLQGGLTESGAIVVSLRKIEKTSGGTPPMKRSNFFLSTILSSIAASAVAAQDTATTNTTNSGDNIVVTGTRSTDRTALETAVPVDVFSVEELTNSGRVELNQILSATVPSFNFNQTAINDGTDIIRPATLRGLSPDQTLVLLNSKRRHSTALVNINGSAGRGSAAVDLNSIPTSAIGSVQVLRDGASAQYGSDAIAGVINVLLREASEGAELNVRYGGHVTNPGAFDRSITDGGTLTIGGWAGFSLTENGFATISFEYSDREPTNRAGPDPRGQYIVANPVFDAVAGTVTGDVDPRNNTFNRVNHRYGNGNAENLSIFLNSGIELNEDWEVYLSGGYQDRNADSAGFYRRSSDSAPSPLGTRSTPRNLTEIYPDGFLPLIVGDVTDFSVSGGLRGNLAGWSSDLSVTYGSNELDYTISNTLNASLGPTSPTEFDAGALKFTQLSVNADVTRTFEDLAPGTLTVTFGGEYRDEGYVITAGEPNSYINGGYRGIPGVNYAPEIGVNVPVGFDITDTSTYPDPFDSNFGVGFAAGSQVFAGFTPQSAVDVGRHSFGVFADVEWEPTEQILLSGAVRFEDYSDFGSATTFKFAGRYDIIDQIAIRGAISTGFRAPSLQQQFFTTTSTNFIGTPPEPFEVGTFPATSAPAVALGGGQLGAEKSDNYSVGVVLRPTDNWFLTVDLFQIDIDDQIFLTENLSGTAVDMALADAGVTGVDRVRFFQNGIVSKTKGIDVVTNYDLDLGNAGELGLSGAFNLSDVQILSVPESTIANGPTLFTAGRVQTLEEGAPASKLILGANWSYGNARANVRGTRYGSVEVVDGGFTIPSEWVLDFAVDADVTDFLNVGVGVDNILDQYPVSQTNFNGIFAYPSRSPFGFSGRFVYARASLRL